MRSVPSYEQPTFSEATQLLTVSSTRSKWAGIYQVQVVGGGYMLDFGTAVTAEDSDAEREDVATNIANCAAIVDIKRLKGLIQDVDLQLKDAGRQSFGR